MMTIATPNETRTTDDTVRYLSDRGYPPIPVAPAFPADQYLARDDQGNPKRDRD